MWNGPYTFEVFIFSTFWGNNTSSFFFFFQGWKRVRISFSNSRSEKILCSQKNIQILLSRKVSDWPLTIPLSCNTINTYKLFHKIYMVLERKWTEIFCGLNHYSLISQVPWVTFHDQFKPLFCLLPKPPLSLWFFSHDCNTSQREWRKRWLK